MRSCLIQTTGMLGLPENELLDEAQALEDALELEEDDLLAIQDADFGASDFINSLNRSIKNIIPSIFRIVCMKRLYLIL